MPQAVQQPLEFLIYISIALLVIIGAFVIKLLYDMSGLVKVMQNFVSSTQNELEPTIKEVQTTLVNINSISSNVNKQIVNINNGIKKSADVVSSSASNLRNRLNIVGLSIKDGFISALDVLMSPKK